MNYEIVKTHIFDIQPGDTILFHGNLKTVGKANIKRDPFIGRTIFGDSYMGGRNLVDKAVIKRAMPSGLLVNA